MFDCKFDWGIAAAWVQGLGSVFAIIAAIWIGKSSEKRARELVVEERERQASLIASTLCTKLELIGLEMEGSLTRLRDFLERGDDYLLQISQDQYFRLVMPPHLKHLSLLRSQLTQFDGDVGRLALDLVDSLEAHAEACDRFLHGLKYFREVPDELRKILAALTGSMDHRIGYIRQVRPIILARYTKDSK